MAEELYKLLIAPCDESVERSERIVLCPDGPLHALPFAALRDESGDYLTVKKPLSSILSCTVLSEIRKTGRRNEGGKLAAFGDPEYGKKGEGNVEMPKNAVVIAPLPASAVELEYLAAIYGDQAEIYAGAGATERNVLKLDDGVDYIHFACHGIMDEYFPLNSGLLMSPPAGGTPGDENGILQAWEIFQSLRINADLVTLSACETGLGKEMGGEGLIGLSRAFQYAGSRSVLSSLWSVADESTAEFMKLFYQKLQSGMPKDKALRSARRAFLENKAGSGKDYAHPFYWAPFTLYGDWK